MIMDAAIVDIGCVAVCCRCHCYEWDVTFEHVQNVFGIHLDRVSRAAVFYTSIESS